MNVHDRLRALRSLPLEQIAELPPMSNEEEAVVAGKKLRFITWHDKLDSGEHRVVVASYETHALSSYRIEASGFAVNSTGGVRSLSNEEMDPFR